MVGRSAKVVYPRHPTHRHRRMTSYRRKGRHCRSRRELIPIHATFPHSASSGRFVGRLQHHSHHASRNVARNFECRHQAPTTITHTTHFLARFCLHKLNRAYALRHNSKCRLFRSIRNSVQQSRQLQYVSDRPTCPTFCCIKMSKNDPSI